MKNDKGLMVEEPKKDSELNEGTNPPLTYKDMKALKKSNYETKSSNYKTIFVIQNKRTGQIAELKAFNALQAAGFIGWRPRHVKLIETKEEK